jgi:hypothetical protein
MTRHFQSEEDVQGHFALQLELASVPSAPLNFWDQVERSARAISSGNGRKLLPLVNLDLCLLAFPEIKFRNKTRPLRPVEYLRAIPDLCLRTAKTYRLAGANEKFCLQPMSHEQTRRMTRDEVRPVKTWRDVTERRK